MTHRTCIGPAGAALWCGALLAAPAFASETGATSEKRVAEAEVEADAETGAVSVQSAAQTPPAGAPAFTFSKPVFDDTWATIGIGVGFVPSYAGSDDYVAFPLPLIVGRLGGVGISPNGPGLVLDLNSPPPAMRVRKGARIAFGPAFRFRNDRNNRIRDDVVARAGRLDAALEVGGNVAIGWPGVFKLFDQLSVGVQARRDVLGAHDGVIIEPQITYRAPVGRSFAMQVQAGAEFVDDNFADYYFTVSPAQALATGLPQFRADGGLNRIGTTAILTYDLDGNPLSGGWAITGIGGYSRLIGDSANTPYTRLRGDADQFIIGAGLAYTF